MIKILILLLSMLILPTYGMENNYHTAQVQNQQISLEGLPQDILFYIIDQYLILHFKHPEEIFVDVVSLKKTCKKLNTLIDEFFEFLKNKYPINDSSFGEWCLRMKKIEEIQMDRLIKNQFNTRRSMGRNQNLVLSLRLWKHIEIEEKFKNKKIISKIRKTVEEEELNFRNSIDDIDFQKFKKTREKMKVFLTGVMNKKEINPDQVKWLLKLTEFTHYDSSNLESEIINLGKEHHNGKIKDLCNKHPRILDNHIKPIEIVICMLIIGLFIVKIVSDQNIYNNF